MRLKFILIVGVLFLLVFFSCSTGGKKIVVDSLQGKDSAQAVEFQRRLREINKNAPKTIASSFIISGKGKEKKFKLTGSFNYDRKGLSKISLVDYVFKSPVFSVYRNMDKVFLYYPTEKKIYLDNFNKIELQRYTGFPADFHFMYYLFSGRIPELKDGKFVKCLGEIGEESYYLIFENDRFYESIYFKQDVPEKILLIHKLTKEKVEIYIKSVLKKGKAVFFNKLKIVFPVTGVMMDVNFYGTKIDRQLNIIPFNLNKVKKGVEIVNVN